MEGKTTLSEEELHMNDLLRRSRQLTRFSVAKIKKDLETDPSNLDLRYMLFRYYSQWTDVGLRLRHKGSQRRLFEIISWIIDHHPGIEGALGHVINHSSVYFSSNRFDKLREKWLYQVEKFPSDVNVIGNAAMFIFRRDIDVACDLFERAYEIEPNESWMLWMMFALETDWSEASEEYKESYCQRFIDAGTRSLQTEDGSKHIVWMHLANAAWAIGDFECVKSCAQNLVKRGDDDDYSSQVGHAYLGLLALKEHNIEEARRCLNNSHGIGTHGVVFKLIEGLFLLGERQLLVQFIDEEPVGVRQKQKSRWIEAINSNQLPDFAKGW